MGRMKGPQWSDSEVEKFSWVLQALLLLPHLRLDLAIA
uniref:Uncharacterized protein n=1 Tax=Rhizophora mucronata TaxID=61149 RepID=A0A2P2MB40_RHIMU